MANEEQLKILKSGIEQWHRWRGTHPDIFIDLNGADLEGMNLQKANLAGARLEEADLAGAKLQRAMLNEASLVGAKLDAANLNDAQMIGADMKDTRLIGASLIGTHLNNANLSGAMLNGADFRGAQMDAVDLTEAYLFETVLGNVDLRTVTGLNSCRHIGPSLVDHRTLLKSGPLPSEFLRGCGPPNDLIEFLPSLMKRPIQFYSCFISDSTQDQNFAERIHADLQNKGVRCWFAPHDIQGGRKIHEQIDEAIRLNDRLLLILSDHSMNSEWVKTEIAHARQKELNEHRQVLFPISVVPFERIKAWKNFDADTGKDSAREIREYFIPDFTNWKTDHDAYTKAIERLLKDLRNEESASA
jgi:uncharacterized protein YjbI with pentapeptide repeats